MKRRRKRLMRKVVIVGAPIAIIITLSYASIAFLSQASDATYAFEHYFGDEYSEEEPEYDKISEKEEMEETDLEESQSVVTFTVPAKLDTTPDSITALVNKELGLPSDYIPKDLVIPNVYFNFTYFDEKKQMRSEAASALEELFQAAVDDNLALCAVSGYRSYTRQYKIFTNNVLTKGMEHTTQFSAIPGYSEHQTGLSIDVSTKSVKYRLDGSFAETPEGKWLAKNAHRFGYIIRYPEGKSNITGYAYEPWHIRYVGKDLATFLYENDLTLEEYYGFEPSYDYSNTISYDNLVDYGIDLDDVTKKPTATPTIPEEDPEETEEMENEEVTEDNKKDKDKKKNKKDSKEKDSNKHIEDKEKTGEETKQEGKEGSNEGNDPGQVDQGEENDPGLTPSPTPDPSMDPSEGTEGESTDPNSQGEETTVTPTIIPSPTPSESN